MSDMISRKAVYDALECMHFASDAERRYAFSMLEQIPTAQPDASECWRRNCEKMNTVHGLDGTVYTQDKDRQGWSGTVVERSGRR